MANERGEIAPEVDPPGPGDTAPTPPASRGAWLLLALLAAGYVFLAVHSLVQKSVTVDEFGHLPAGYYFLRDGLSQYATLNPPLVNALSALPLLLVDVEAASVPVPNFQWGRAIFWGSGQRFMHEYAGAYHGLFLLGRCMTVVLVGLLGVVLFQWARSLCPMHPDAAGLLAAALLWYAPGTLAHARLVTTDAGAALFVALACWTLHGFLRRPTDARMFICGVALGLAQLSKFYALLLYPVFAVVGFVWFRGWQVFARRRAAWGLVGVFAVSLLVVNAGYLFQGSGYPLGQFFLQSERVGGVVGLLPSGLRVPLPAAFLIGLDQQALEVESRIPSFLWGESFEGGRWYYFLALLAIKVPIPLLILVGAAIFLAIRERIWTLRELTLLLFFPLAFFLLVSLADQRQLGMRALLVVSPLVWLWVAVTLARTVDRARQWAAVGLLLAWAGGETLAAHPHYLAYFNQTVGGREQGYRYASGSNLDWGQDLVGLKRYLDEQGAGRVQLLYFGSVEPGLYGIDYIVPRRTIEPGLLAVSTTLYTKGYRMLDHGRPYEVKRIDPKALGLGDPVASIGGSIHVYRVDRAALLP
jgi:hypothetical protein